jgi:hypothetical protein
MFVSVGRLTRSRTATRSAVPVRPGDVAKERVLAGVQPHVLECPSQVRPMVTGSEDEKLFGDSGSIAESLAS